MRIGYHFHGFLGDVKLGPDGQEISTPDGNATYSWSIVHAARQRGWSVIPLGKCLDEPAAAKFGSDLFSAFSQQKRIKVFEHMLTQGWCRMSDINFPEVDLVLLEWRWPIPGRNTPEDRGTPGFQGDLDRQNELIELYSKIKVPIIIWDLDQKITIEDEVRLRSKVLAIIETCSVDQKKHIIPRFRVEPPFIVNDLLQFEGSEWNFPRPYWNLGYIGSRYERDESIDHWICPTKSRSKNSLRVKFWGKWEPSEEVESRWPGITFANRIGVRSFHEAYSSCSAVPLLAKESYYRSGFITPRPWEAILFGSIPIGLQGHLGIERYCYCVAQDHEDLMQKAIHLKNISHLRRNIIREEIAHNLRFVDARFFLDKLEEII